MPPGSDKRIRSLKDNPAGKVVNDSAGSHWEWNPGEQDETSRLLQRLANDELAIEQTDIVPNPRARRSHQADRDTPKAEARTAHGPPRKPPGGRDAGGGFDPYDNSGKRRR